MDAPGLNPAQGVGATPAYSAPRRRVWKAALLGAVILVCGIVIGAGGAVFGIRYAMMHWPPNPERMRIECTERIRTALVLTEEQNRRVEQIMADHFKAIMAIHQDAEPRMRSEIDRMKAAVALVLTPKQAAEWNEKFHSFFPPPPPPFGGPPHHGPPPEPGGGPGPLP